MNQLLNFGEIVAMNAYVSPDKVGARDRPFAGGTIGPARFLSAISFAQIPKAEWSNAYASAISKAIPSFPRWIRATLSKSSNQSHLQLDVLRNHLCFSRISS
jgi:hypothetical protein